MGTSFLAADLAAERARGFFSVTPDDFDAVNVKTAELAGEPAVICTIDLAFCGTADLEAIEERLGAELARLGRFAECREIIRLRGLVADLKRVMAGLERRLERTTDELAEANVEIVALQGELAATEDHLAEALTHANMAGGA